MLVLCKREPEEGTVSVRRLGSQANTMITLDEAAKAFVDEGVAPDLQ
jgi:threonyl-tRNA synthetase